MGRTRSRPPRLEARVGNVQPAPPPTQAELLERAKVAGPKAAPGRTELRRFVERIVQHDRGALGELAPFDGCSLVEAWAALESVFGATPERPAIDAARTLEAAGRAAARVRDVAGSGARVVFATSAPAALLGLHQALAVVASEAGGEAVDLPDDGPLRIDGRMPRWLRWLDGGVVAVTDGQSLCATRDPEAAREFLFVQPRPALVVADGVFAEVAWEAGLEVVAFAGLDRAALAIAAARGPRGMVVPLRTDRSPRSYAPVRRALRCEM